jgi:hypothetical protein
MGSAVTSASTGRNAQTIHVSTTQAATTAVTTEETLWTYSVPANRLARDGDTLLITAFLTNAANANGKAKKMTIGGTQVARRDSADASGTTKLVATLVRTGASTELAFGEYHAASADNQETIASLALDTTAAIVIAVTGQNAVANANDIVFRCATVDYYPAP